MRNTICGGALMAALLTQGCSTTREHGSDPFPQALKECVGSGDSQCAAGLFYEARFVGPRDPRSFPQRYLELWDPTVVAAHCEEKYAVHIDHETVEHCEKRLEGVSRYFNPGGPPGPDKIAVALEGGGSKTAPFTLGVLAGLQEKGVLEKNVDAIASVSGGSYAASFLFNRLYDKATAAKPVDGDDYEHWFKSCIPDEFADGKHQGMFDALRIANKGEPLPACGEFAQAPELDRCNPFDVAYEFQGHVWMEPDLIMGNSANGLKTSDSGAALADPIVNTLGLLGESALFAPWQALSRTVFRWPGNTAPSKLAYTNGIERQFGYSPRDWRSVESGCTSGVGIVRDFAHVWETHRHRMVQRTMGNLNNALATAKQRDHLSSPRWVIVSSTPGAIGATAWFATDTRDPIRHQFELTPGGYGSGIHGYANVPPRSGNGVLESDFLGPGSDFVPPADSMPIVEAVVASAAFFDDDQTKISSQPTRGAINFFQHVTNITWDKEIPNFNAPESTRIGQRLSPYPFYFFWTSHESTEPYIHLQDGGNSENSGIFPLLRRGYRTIVYAHGTQDDKAQFEAICHLKNQLELDGQYFIRSPSLEGIVRDLHRGGIDRTGPHFHSYLDQLCTEQLDGSDLAVFENNAYRRDLASRSPTVAKLLCGRISDDESELFANRTALDPTYTPCAEFENTFHPRTAKGMPMVPDRARSLPRTYRDIDDLFYRWSGEPLTFFVYRGNALKYRNYDRDPPVEDLVSTIIAVVPSISWSSASGQLVRTSTAIESSAVKDCSDPPPGLDDVDDPWKHFCSLSKEDRAALRIGACYGPGDKLFKLKDQDPPFANEPAIPCTSLAHIIENGCDGGGHPSFPQDNFILQTWNTTYTMFAAYFDLGRHQAWRALSASRSVGASCGRPQASRATEDRLAAHPQ